MLVPLQIKNSILLLFIFVSGISCSSDPDQPNEKLLSRIFEEDVKLPDSVWFEMMGDTAIQVRFNNGFKTDSLITEFSITYTDSLEQPRFFATEVNQLCFQNNRIIIPFGKKLRYYSTLMYQVSVMPRKTFLFQADKNGKYVPTGRYVYRSLSTGTIIIPDETVIRHRKMLVHFNKLDSIPPEDKFTLEEFTSRFRELIKAPDNDWKKYR